MKSREVQDINILVLGRNRTGLIHLQTASWPPSCRNHRGSTEDTECGASAFVLATQGSLLPIIPGSLQSWLI